MILQARKFHKQSSNYIPTRSQLLKRFICWSILHVLTRTQIGEKSQSFKPKQSRSRSLRREPTTPRSSPSTNPNPITGQNVVQARHRATESYSRAQPSCSRDRSRSPQRRVESLVRNEADTSSQLSIFNRPPSLPSLRQIQNIYLQAVRKKNVFEVLGSELPQDPQLQNQQMAQKIQNEQKSLQRLEYEQKLLNSQMKKLKQLRAMNQMESKLFNQKQKLLMVERDSLKSDLLKLKSNQVLVKFEQEPLTNYQGQIYLQPFSLELAMREQELSLLDKQLRFTLNEKSRLKKGESLLIKVYAKIRDLCFIKMLAVPKDSEAWRHLKNQFMQAVKNLQNRLTLTSLTKHIPFIEWYNTFDFYYEKVAPIILNKITNLPPPVQIHIDGEFGAAPFYLAEENMLELIDQQISSALEFIAKISQVGDIKKRAFVLPLMKAIVLKINKGSLKTLERTQYKRYASNSIIKATGILRYSRTFFPNEINAEAIKQASMFKGDPEELEMIRSKHQIRWNQANKHI